MVSTSPRSRFITLRAYFDPLLGLPVKETDAVESLLVGPSPSEENEPIIVFIVMHGAIRPV